MQAEMNRGYAALGSGYVGGQAVGADTTAAGRQLEVPAGISRIDSNLGALACMVDTLDQRLTGYVARSSPPQKDGSNQVKPVPSCGLGQQLDTIGDRIDQATRRLNDLMERLEA